MDRSKAEHTLEQAVEFLEGPATCLIKAEPRAELLQKAARLLDKARHSSELLYVGILGGTGVGKSTLINALAAKEISTPSDRRPFTDKAVVYRHVTAQRGLDEVSHLLREPDALHDRDAVKEFILLDLPDFDSVQPENRRRVIEIIPHLDCIVWVVSPEKYADEVFYDLVRDTIMNRENFTFVLNKADQLRKGSETGKSGKTDPQARFKDVLGDFMIRLKYEAGLEQPRVFSVSAANQLRGNALDPILDREFERFRDYLMKRRDAKEIVSVRTVNLIEKTRALLSEIRRTVRPEDKKRLINTIRAMDEKPTEAIIGARLLTKEREARLASAIYSLLASEDRSVAPVKLAMRALLLGAGTGASVSPEGLTAEFNSAAEAIGKEVRDDLKKVCSQMDSEILLEIGRVGDTDLTSYSLSAMDEALQRAAWAFSEAVNFMRNSVSGRMAAVRRFRQKLILYAPLVVLAVKLAGLSRIEALIDKPSVGGAFKLVMALLTALFSSDGLVGLCVVLICEVLLVWYLAAGRLKKLDKDSGKLAASAINFLKDGLASATKQAREVRMHAARRIEEGVTILGNLEETMQERL